MNSLSGHDHKCHKKKILKQGSNYCTKNVYTFAMYGHNEYNIETKQRKAQVDKKLAMISSTKFPEVNKYFYIYSQF